MTRMGATETPLRRRPFPLRPPHHCPMVPSTWMKNSEEPDSVMVLAHRGSRTGQECGWWSL